MKNIDGLLRNEWELYNSKEMMKKKGALVGVVMVFLWYMEFILFSTLVDVFYGALIATVIVVVVAVVSIILLKKIDVQKDGWYFAGYQRKGLKWEHMLSFMKWFLTENGYIFQVEEHRAVGSLKITFFNLQGKNFKIRLWYTVMGGTPIIEIGIGPRKEDNHEEIEKLKKEISKAFADYVTKI